MYVLSASNRRVSIELVGKEKIEDKLSRFEELTSASLSYLGISSPGAPFEICSVVPSRLFIFFQCPHFFFLTYDAHYFVQYFFNYA